MFEPARWIVIKYLLYDMREIRRFWFEWGLEWNYL